ncbi:MAG: hypothetical protein E6J52_06955 [Chloroflexi bacterium]|nr:MAG: hypothetical protein E6J52_06955 [Chloroflexota bacterium]
MAGGAPAGAGAPLGLGRTMRPGSLSGQLLMMQLALVIGIVGLTAAGSYALVSSQIDEQYTQRALAVAHSVAATPDIVEAMADPDPPKVIQPIAEAIRRSVGASFVVVANKEGIRYSHPNPDNIGKRVSTDPSAALAGEEFVGWEDGTLGRSLRAKVPLKDGRGNVVGIVSVGFLEQELSARLGQALPTVTLSVLLAAFVGLGGSLWLGACARCSTARQAARTRSSSRANGCLSRTGCRWRSAATRSARS